MTFTLPYAGATRIRFKGLPVSQALSLTVADTPSNGACLTKRWWQVKLADRFGQTVL